MCVTDTEGCVSRTRVGWTIAPTWHPTSLTCLLRDCIYCRWLHPIHIPYQHPLSIPLINTPYQHSLLINTSIECILSIWPHWHVSCGIASTAGDYTLYTSLFIRTPYINTPNRHPLLIPLHPLTPCTLSPQSMAITLSPLVSYHNWHTL